MTMQSNSAVPTHLLLVPDIPHSDLSLEEIGVLSQMLNVPECDYITPKQLSDYASDSPKKVTSILDSLVEKEYLHRSENVYFVNKFKATEMHLCKIPSRKVIRFTDENGGEEA